MKKDFVHLLFPQIFLIIFLSSFFPSITSSQVDNDTAKYSLKMTLQKNVYKLYEPVIARFELINHDRNPLEIYDLFEPLTTSATVFISDDRGNHWEKNHVKLFFDLIYGYPEFIINTGDTLIVSMPISNWGADLASHNIADLFYQYGYFPAGGKYKAHFYASSWVGQKIKSELQSNEVEFETKEIDKADSSIIGIFKKIFGIITADSAADLAESMFPDNSLTEYLTASKMQSVYNKAISNQEDNYDEILNGYERFFKRYPSSNYMYGYNFMRPLYYELFYCKNDYRNVIKYASKKFNNPQLSSLFANSVLLDWVKSSINGKKTREYKQSFVTNPISRGNFR